MSYLEEQPFAPPPRPSVLLRTAPGLLALVLLGPDGVERWVESGAELAVNTDERNLLEFHAPLFLHRGVDLTRQNLLELRRLGGDDPVVSYLPELRGSPTALRYLAARNAHFGDFWEALTLLREDRSPEGESLIEDEIKKEWGSTHNCAGIHFWWAREHEEDEDGHEGSSEDQKESREAL